LGTRRNCHILSDGREPEHIDANRPHAVREIGKLVNALPIGDGRELFVALRRGDGGARNGQASEPHLSVVLRRERLPCTDQEQDQKSDGVAVWHRHA